MHEAKKQFSAVYKKIMAMPEATAPKMYMLMPMPTPGTVRPEAAPVEELEEPEPEPEPVVALEETVPVP